MGMPEQAQKSQQLVRQRSRFLLDRRYDAIFVFGVLFIVIGAAHVVFMLLAGDWDFWTDWKDRQWWPLMVPVMGLIVPSALQYIAWTLLRLPIGATLAAVCLVIGEWVNRFFNFHGWTDFPLNFVWPSTMVPTAILLDVILMWTNSWLLTTLFGASLWGLLFGVENMPLIAPFRIPVEYGGYVLSTADVQGFQYLRTTTPEYIRIVEQGNFRAFLQQFSTVTAVAAAVISFASYWFGQLIGRVLAVLPIGKFMKQT
ncbi:MAG: methane monooxygenase/ammonia monooxygenase subunit A [Alicyclobacillaceae bacterium]|nr:methane monooxygenase/ammonia monooxygenase subunit A [Alicyclobacillaceae bacterium]